MKRNARPNDGDESLRAFWKRTVRLSYALTFGGAAVLFAALANGRAAAIGFLLGGSVSVLRFSLRYRALARLNSVGPLVRLRLLTYALNGLALAVAFARADAVSPWTTAAGLLVMNVSLIATELLYKGGGIGQPGVATDTRP